MPGRNVKMDLTGQIMEMLNMNTEIKLDKWDYQLILSFKRYNDNHDIPRAINIWAERGMLDKQYIQIEWVTQRLLHIIELIKTQTKSFIYDTMNILEQASPAKDCDFNSYALSPGPEKRYWERLFLVLSVLIAHTKSEYFPGLDDYFTNVWLKEGNP